MSTPIYAAHERYEARDAAAPVVELALAQGLAERLGRLARLRGVRAPAVDWLERAAYAVSRATAEGHVCVSLSSLDRPGLPHDRGEVAAGPGQPARGRVPASLPDLRATLLATGLVCDGRGADAALAPLVLDVGNRLYLARYFAYERQLARALLLRSPVLREQGPGASDRAAHSSKDNAPHGGNPDGLDATAVAQLAAWFGNPQHGERGQVDQIDWQRVAAALALSGRLTVISGGPGTGKTSTVVAILASLLTQAAAQRQPLPRIALAAPTGKAAQRMQEALHERADKLPAALAAALPRQAYTLHRLLGVGADGRFRHHRDAPLPYDVVVVDEASMIDVALAARLVDAVPADSRLILLGDKDQLAAVEAGAVFAELSAHPQLSAGAIARLAPALGLSAERLDALLPPSRRSRPEHPPMLADCVVWLERNYRFGLTSPIGRLSLAIRDGKANDALAVLAGHPEHTALYEDGEARLSDAALARLTQGYGPYAQALSLWLAQAQAQRHEDAAQAGFAGDPTPLFDAFNLYRVLCATRGGARGVLALNRRLAMQIKSIGASSGERIEATTPSAAWTHAAAGVAGAAQATTIVDNEMEWYAGRPVMVTRNDYAMGLFNGDIGIALPTAQGLRLVFRQAGGGYRWVSPATLPQHETAFAMTVHKSQGSEFAEAAVVLPARASRVLTRELVYTAVTRARERVILYAASAVLAQAIVARTERDSGLAARLAEAWDAAQS